MTATHPEAEDPVVSKRGTELVARYDTLGLMRIQERLAMTRWLELEPAVLADVSWESILRRDKLGPDVELWADVKHGLAGD